MGREKKNWFFFCLIHRYIAPKFNQPTSNQSKKDFAQSLEKWRLDRAGACSLRIKSKNGELANLLSIISLLVLNLSDTVNIFKF